MKKTKSALEVGLPKTTSSLCPVCKEIISAEVFERDGSVWMRKECAKHGEFEDIYWSDADLYLKVEKFAFDGEGVYNPNIPDAEVCPFDCGLCNLHLSHTALANIDLTNRCNLQCPICFANANVAGYVYEPSFDEVVDMLKVLRANEPVATVAVQFAGGEPTIYPRFFDAIRKASELGFPQVQVATNGIKIARDPNFAQEMLDAGLHTVYLQFDGLNDDNYIQARGKPLLETKMKAIENLRNTTPKPLSTVLVPTIVNGINDDQVGSITQFAVDNVDVVRSVIYQPVSFAGRISQEQRLKERFTLSDLVDRLVKQTGYLEKDDFYPVPCVTPISELAGLIDGKPKVTFSAHPHCGIATYLFVEGDKVIPITHFVDVMGFLSDTSEIVSEVRNKDISTAKIPERMIKSLQKHFDKDRAPKDMDPLKFIQSLFMADGKSGLSEIHWKMILVSGMHFQDAFNYDIERVRRCLVHYATPDPKRRIVPFCAYNSGPVFREEIEAKYGIPLDEWKKRNKEET
ncbi:MAG: radical SAM protein [Halobacteriota archaeon]|nr:radical SAM protein [Halobacteriota archaeon]